MAKLPPTSWLTLDAALKYVVEETDIHTWRVVENALSAAFRDEIVKTRGRCLEFFDHGMQVPLSGVVWSGAKKIAWSGGLFKSEIDDGISRRTLSNHFFFEDVEVERESLEWWLSSTKVEPEPAPAIDIPAEGKQDKRGRPSKNDYEAFEAIIKSQADRLGDDWFALKTNAALAEQTRKWMAADLDISDDVIPKQRMAEKRIATMRKEGRLPPRK